MTQNASALDCLVNLFGGDEFKSTTSGQHEALAFNIDKSTISLSKLTGSDFTLVSSSEGSQQQDGLGNFNYLISSSKTGDTMMSFEIANIGFSDITSNSLGNFFEVDLFSGANGNCGSVGGERVYDGCRTGERRPRGADLGDVARRIRRPWLYRFSPIAQERRFDLLRVSQHAPMLTPRSASAAGAFLGFSKLPRRTVNQP